MISLVIVCAVKPVARQCAERRVISITLVTGRPLPPTQAVSRMATIARNSTFPESSTGEGKPGARHHFPLAGIKRPGLLWSVVRRAGGALHRGPVKSHSAEGFAGRYRAQIGRSSEVCISISFLVLSLMNGQVAYCSMYRTLEASHASTRIQTCVQASVLNVRLDYRAIARRRAESVTT